MRLKTLLLACLFLLPPVMATAQDKKEVLLLELYAQSGLEKQIGELPGVIQVAFDQAAASDERLKVVPRSAIGEIREAVERAYATNSIKKTILGECRKNLKINDLKQVLRWLRSPTGRKLTQLEEAASTPEKYAEMQRFAKHLQESLTRPERLKIMRQLDSATKATETGVEIAMNTQLAIAIAVSATLPREQQPTYDHLAAAVEKGRPRIEAQVETQTLVSLLFIYGKVSRGELDRYITFASSPAGTRYHNALISGLKKALVRGGYEWGKLIAGILKRSKGKTVVQLILPSPFRKGGSPARHSFSGGVRGISKVGAPMIVAYGNPTPTPPLPPF